MNNNYNPDKKLYNILLDHINDEEIIKYINSFQRRMYAIKQFAYYELYQIIKELPGDIVECGVFKGDSLFTLARLVETFSTGDRTKTVWGFDHFKGLSNRSSKDGYDSRVGNTEHGWNPENFKKAIYELVDIFNEDSFVPKKPRIKLIDGDINDTAPKFVENNPGLRLSLLHLDMDLFEPTLAALNAFYPLLVKGGILVLDEVYIKEWPGETSAFEEYFAGNPPQLKKFSWCSAPGGYLIK